MQYARESRVPIRRNPQLRQLAPPKARAELFELHLLPFEVDPEEEAPPPKKEFELRDDFSAHQICFQSPEGNAPSARRAKAKSLRG